MDKNKLLAYLDSRKKSMSGQLFGIPMLDNTVPSMEELDQMPEDLKKLVIQAQLNQAGSYTPAAKDIGYTQPKAEVGMADELYSEETGEPKNRPFSSIYPDIPKGTTEASENVARFAKLKSILEK